MKKPAKYLTIGLLAAVPFILWAADHAEAPVVESDQGADIADVYAFLDPNDNTKAILAFDVHGFIVPGENGNLGGFDAEVTFRFNIENTGDAQPDTFIEVNFEEQTSRSQPQLAHVKIDSANHGKKKSKKRDNGNAISFTAPTTVSSATAAIAPSPVVTTDGPSGISFFAGVTDDPFFFDIPGFNRFLGSVLSGSPQLNFLNRGRDTFAGYNIQMIALRVPVSLLKGSAGNVIGVSATTLRSHEKNSGKKSPKSSTPEAVDRMGVPAINTVLIPFLRKNEYNQSTTVDDSTGKFAADIIATLQAVGTDATHIGILASVAVVKGDMLRLDTSISNSGPQGGTTANAGFPNGRRPTDDVIDTVLFLVTNEALTTGDHVNANDMTFRDTFPFFAASHQPLDTGITDDKTRN